MLTTSLVQLWRICLHPTPDAAGIYRYAPFRYDLGDMLVSQRISKVPTHRQKDQFARVLASLERIGWRDRHEIPSLPNLFRNFAMEPRRLKPGTDGGLRAASWTARRTI